MRLSFYLMIHSDFHFQQYWSEKKQVGNMLTTKRGGKHSSPVHTVKENQYHTPRLMVFLFGPFEPPSKRKNDTNDISFKSPDIGLLEF